MPRRLFLREITARRGKNNQLRVLLRCFQITLYRNGNLAHSSPLFLYDSTYYYNTYCGTSSTRLHQIASKQKCRRANLHGGIFYP